jgi:tetratricopeptide (TPR) repeat protein
MQLTNDKIDQIELYLQGQLDEDQRRELEVVMKQDQEFKQLVEEHKLMLAGVKYAARNTLVSQLKALEATLEPPVVKQAKQVRLKKIYYAVAAAVAFILLAVAVMLIFPQQTPEKMAANYFEPYPTTLHAITRSSNQAENDFQKAMQLYEAGEYRQAVLVLDDLYEREPNEIVKFYLAVAYQADGMVENAIAHYQSIISNGSLFADQASWYLALCYLEVGQMSEARKLLKQVKQSDSNFSSKASDILLKLND